MLASPAPATTENTCALILAGGRGSRMNGLDKGLINWHGRHLIEHVLDRLTDNFQQIIISANRHIEEYQQFNHPVVPDTYGNYAGPLAGILSAMQYNQQAEFFMVLPCDGPFAPSNLFTVLSAAINSHHSSPIAVAHDGERIQPLFGLYHRSVSSHIEATLAADKLKVQKFLHEVGAISVDFSDQIDAFRNFNRPQDLDLNLDQ